MLFRSPEDARAGTIYFHNYCIMSDQEDGAKNIVVPVGTKIVFTAFKNGAKCLSDWIIEGLGHTETIGPRSEIDFVKSMFIIPEWYTRPFSDLKAGFYRITEAQDHVNEVLKDTGSIFVFGGDFLEHTSHNYGFDDYTGWQWLGIDGIFWPGDPAVDYYDQNKSMGRCVWPYISVENGGTGTCNLSLTLPRAEPPLYDVESSSAQFVCSPTTTPASTPVSFDSSATGRSEGTLSAKYAGTELAQIQVVSFPRITSEVLVINVNGATSPIINLNYVNEVYRQCVTDFEPLCEPVSFTFSDAPANNVWSETDLNALQLALVNDSDTIELMILAKYVIVVVPGLDAEGYLGWGAGPYVWLYDSTTLQKVLPHELGHTMGLEDEYTPGPNGTNVSGKDKDNLMNNLAGSRLRYGQWKTANSVQNE